MAEPEEKSKKKSGQGKYEWKLEKTCNWFSGDHKKEELNNEERVLSEIKIAGMEEPAEENLTSDNLEMAELTPAPGHPTQDINIESEKYT